MHPRSEEYLPARQAELLLQRANTAMEQLTEYLTTCDGPQTDRGIVFWRTHGII